MSSNSLPSRRDIRFDTSAKFITRIPSVPLCNWNLYLQEIRSYKSYTHTHICHRTYTRTHDEVQINFQEGKPPDATYYFSQMHAAPELGSINPFYASEMIKHFLLCQRKRKRKVMRAWFWVGRYIQGRHVTLRIQNYLLLSLSFIYMFFVKQPNNLSIGRLLEMKFLINSPD